MKKFIVSLIATLLSSIILWGSLYAIANKTNWLDRLKEKTSISKEDSSSSSSSEDSSSSSSSDSSLPEETNYEELYKELLESQNGKQLELLGKYLNIEIQGRGDDTISVNAIENVREWGAPHYHSSLNDAIVDFISQNYGTEYNYIDSIYYIEKYRVDDHNFQLYSEDFSIGNINFSIELDGIDSLDYDSYPEYGGWYYGYNVTFSNVVIVDNTLSCNVNFVVFQCFEN